MKNIAISMKTINKIYSAVSAIGELMLEPLLVRELPRVKVGLGKIGETDKLDVSVFIPGESPTILSTYEVALVFENGSGEIGFFIVVDSRNDFMNGDGEMIDFHNNFCDILKLISEYYFES